MKSISIAAGCGAVLVVSGTLALAAQTPAQKCQDAIASAARKYFDSRYKAQAKCRDKRAVSGTPADCSVDPAVTDAIASAESRLSTRITTMCPGGVVAQTDLGLACKGALTPTDVVDCVTDDVHGPRVDELIAAGYDASGQISNAAVRICQKTISKALRKGASTRQKTRRACAKKIALVEDAPEICPDAHALASLDRARDKLITLVEQKCDDTQVLDTALKFGGECGDDRAGA